MVGGVGIRTGEVRGEHFRLLPKWRNQAVDLAAVLHALTDCKNPWVVRAQAIVDHDAALDGQTGAQRQTAIGLDARGDHHQNHS